MKRSKCLDEVRESYSTGKEHSMKVPGLSFAWGILCDKLLPCAEGSLTIIKERSAATKRWIREKSERRKVWEAPPLIEFQSKHFGNQRFWVSIKAFGKHPFDWVSVKACWLCLIHFSRISSVQSLSHVRLFATPWITARQASLSITNSQSSLKLMSIESVIPSSHLILCCPLLLPKTNNSVAQRLMCFAKQKRSSVMRSCRCLISLW